jgi:hypothetical protein
LDHFPRFSFAVPEPEHRIAEKVQNSNTFGMDNPASTPNTFTVTVFTRHKDDCPRKGDPQWKRCKCRKSLYLYEDGHKSYVSAKTRSWEQAEKLAQAERDRRDPVKVELQKIAELKAKDEEAAAIREVNQITIEDALDRWTRSRKEMSDGTAAAYRVVVRKIKDWATLKGLKYLKEVTPALLDEWRGLWSMVADRKDDRTTG